MKLRSFVTLVATFTLGIAIGLAKGKAIDPNTYRGKSNQDAAKALLDIAKTQALKGTWENIAVGRAMYGGGMKDEGQAIFDSITSKKPEAADWLRIGRAYYDAGDWEKAKDAFDNAGTSNAAWDAEIGAYYNLKGERAKAEEFFDKSFAIDSTVVWNTTNMGGSYVGVEPLR